MTPKQIMEALQQGKWEEAGKAILNQGLFIGYPAETDTSWKGNLTRKLNHGGRCNECGVWISQGANAVWIKGNGVWHVDCYAS